MSTQGKYNGFAELLGRRKSEKGPDTLKLNTMGLMANEYQYEKPEDDIVIKSAKKYRKRIHQQTEVIDTSEV